MSTQERDVYLEARERDVSILVVLRERAEADVAEHLRWLREQDEIGQALLALDYDVIALRAEKLMQAACAAGMLAKEVTAPWREKTASELRAGVNEFTEDDPPPYGKAVRHDA